MWWSESHGGDDGGGFGVPLLPPLPCPPAASAMPGPITMATDISAAINLRSLRNFCLPCDWPDVGRVGGRLGAWPSIERPSRGYCRRGGMSVATERAECRIPPQKAVTVET